MPETPLMPAALAALKAKVRAARRAAREALASDAVLNHSAAIARAACSLPIYAAAATICAYVAFDNEVQTTQIVRDAFTRGKRLLLPRTARRENRLALHAVEDVDHLIPGPFGIPEPSAQLPEAHPAEVDLYFVPGLAFDAAGNRLGFGAGFYDSLLRRSGGWRVALAHSCQLVPAAPAGPRDVPVDFIITEMGMVDCRQGRAAGDHLRLRDMVFHGHHGAFPSEREQGIRLAVDLDLRLDLQVPGLTDDLATSVNYPAVYRLIDRIQSEREFALFEALVEQIALAVLREFPLVAEVTVRARKFHPPVGGLMDAFEVEICRARPRWARSVEASGG